MILLPLRSLVPCSQIGAAIASEARAVGIDTAFSPVLNMWVDSRFGRLQEGFTENPTLTYSLAHSNHAHPKWLAARFAGCC